MEKRIQPLPLSSLVGRKRELQEINSLLASGQARLITLIGPGGVGKTRLALQIGAQAHRIFGSGAYFVPLAYVSEPGLVLATIAQTLGVREIAGGSLLASICEALAHKHMLLVLDNFEQVTAAAPDVVELLECSPRLCVLITSRTALHVQGGHTYPVSPLPLPEASGQESAEQVSQYEAVALFIERARAARPEFRINNRNAPAVAEICQRLDGLPLAIELAAARIRLISPQALLKRLDARLPLLASVSPNVPRRHQTLRDAIAWSYDLLTSEEKKHLRCLCVFAGGFTLEAAAAVCGDPGPELNMQPQERELQQLDALHVLADKSLLRHDEHDEHENGEPRFSMLETIREFAHEELIAEGEAERAQQRHARYFLEFAERAAHELGGPNQSAWLDRLELEHNNVRAALHNTHRSGDIEVCLRIGTGVQRFWRTRGYIDEGRKWLSDALEAAGTVSPALRAKALNAAGVLAGVQSDYAAAGRYFNVSLDLARASGDKLRIVTALGNAANAQRLQGDYEQATANLREALELAREIDNKPGIAVFLRNLGIIAAEQGSIRLSQELSAAALEVYREMGDSQGAAMTLSGMTMSAISEGEYGTARKYGEEAMVIFRRLGDQGGEAGALEYLGEVALHNGEYAQAKALLLDSLRLRHGQKGIRGITACLRGLAAAEQATGGASRAVRLLAASESLAKSLGAPVSARSKAQSEALVAGARASIGQEEFSRAWEQGSSTSVDDAVEFALGISPPESTGGTGSGAGAGIAGGVGAGAGKPGSALTARELEVLRLVAAGLTNASIASQLHLSVNTVQTHLRSIFSKIDVATRSAAVRYVFENALG